MVIPLLFLLLWEYIPLLSPPPPLLLLLSYTTTTLPPSSSSSSSLSSSSFCSSCPSFSSSYSHPLLILFSSSSSCSLPLLLFLFFPPPLFPQNIAHEGQLLEEALTQFQAVLLELVPFMNAPEEAKGSVMLQELESAPSSSPSSSPLLCRLTAMGAYIQLFIHLVKSGQV